MWDEEETDLNRKLDEQELAEVKRVYERESNEAK